MKTKIKILLALAATTLTAFAAEPPTAKAEQETRYLAFQIFTRFTPDPKDAQAMSSGMREPLVPGTTALRNYVEDIKQRIGAVGDRQTRLAVMLGPLCFDQSDAEITQFVEKAFDLALEADVAVGFHIDDSMFWRSRKDLWSDPANVEAMDWDETPNTSRRLNWSKMPTSAPPQMCFNSKAIQREVQQRGTLIGKAIQTGVNRLQQLKRPELFAGVIVGWETMIGQDYETGKYLGYRALLNRGFSREHPPQDMNAELEKVVQEFIERWTTGIAEAGVSPQHIYSHTAFLSRRAFNMDDNKAITYMQKSKDAVYSQHNHFAPPWVAFGKNHRPGFSTYPQPGLFEDIYELMEKHQQVGWASSEGTNMQPGTGPGQTGMNMETYLAKMFNHGATLITIFSWGIGGEAHKNMSYRLCTENEEALQAYRKFLKGEPLVEGVTVAGLQERLPPKIHRIEKELPAWMEKTHSQEAAALMQKMHGQMKAKDWLEVEKTADSILKMMDGGAPTAAQDTPIESKAVASSLMERLPLKIQQIQKELPTWVQNADHKEKATAFMQKLKEQLDAKNFEEAEKTADSILAMMGASAQPAVSPGQGNAESPADPVEAAHRRLTEKIERVKQGAQKWAASGRDPSAILQTMQEKVGPLIKAGKFSESEPEVDRVLEQLNQDAKSTQSPVSPPAPTQATPDITEELRDKLAHNLGSSFLLFRTKVLGELQVTQEQKAKLDHYLQTLLPEAMQVLQKNNGGRGKYNQKTHEERAAVLKEILNEDQRTRLHQLELQKDLLFGPAWNMQELQITEKQQQQFMAPIQEKQKQTQALMAELHKGANPDEIRPKALQLRLDLEVQLETLLTDAQKKKWKEMQGKPVDPGVIYGGL
jgi:hypothetical protein